MKQASFINKIKFQLIKIMQLQLFLSIVSLPILISWGLPISLASPIGNLIFTPILSIFLFLSSLIFFFELFNMPNEIFIYLLEKVTYFWTKCLSLGTDKWLISFPTVSTTFLLMIPITAILILQNKKTNSLKTSCILFSIILILSGAYLKFSVDLKDLKQEIDIESKKFKLEILNKKISIVDYQDLGKSSKSFLEFSFIPYLIKKFGTSNIENITIFNPRKRDLKSIEFLLTKIKIGKIYFISNKKKPYFQKSIDSIQNNQKADIIIKFTRDY